MEELAGLEGTLARSDGAQGAVTPSSEVGGRGSWKKHVWQAAEDAQLHQLVTSALSEGKVRWSTIGARMDGRSGKQCRERWHNHLSPHISKNDWTPQVRA